MGDCAFGPPYAKLFGQEQFSGGSWSIQVHCHPPSTAVTAQLMSGSPGAHGQHCERPRSGRPHTARSVRNAPPSHGILYWTDPSTDPSGPPLCLAPHAPLLAQTAIIRNPAMRNRHMSFIIRSPGSRTSSSKKRRPPAATENGRPCSSTPAHRWFMAQGSAHPVASARSRSGFVCRRPPGQFVQERVRLM
jgi:hypothetical protein